MTTLSSAASSSGVLTSLDYYEDLIANATADSIFRPEGSNLDVLTLPNSATSIAICHLSVLNDLTESGQAVNTRYEEIFGIALALHHLNVGDGSLAPAVDGLDQRCPIRFTLQDMSDSTADQGTALDHVVRQTSRDKASTKRLPCAFIGSYRSAISMPTSMITGLRGYPQISFASSSTDLDDKGTHPLFARTIASDQGNAFSMLQLFSDLWKVKRIAVLHIDDPYGNAYAAGIKLAMKQQFPHMTVAEVVVPNTSLDPQAVQEVVESLKITQFRYVFAILFDAFDEIMTEAYHQGIAGTGKHNWIFSDSLEPGRIMNRTFERGSIQSKAYRGVGFVGMSGGLPGTPSYDNYLSRMVQMKNAHDVGFVQRRTTKLDYLEGDGFLNPPASAYPPFAYDATIALGLAACDAVRRYSDNKSMLAMNGTEHYERLVHQEFQGISGRVVLDPATGSRDPTTYLFKLVNLVAVDDEASGNVRFDEVVTHLYQNGEWNQMNEYIFNDGTTAIRPDLPLLNLNENFLSTGIRVTVLSMCALAFALSIGFTLWTANNHNSKVVKASQPFFLYLILAGSIVLAATIIPLSYDLSTASLEGCNMACVSIPWLVAIGFTLIFSALWAKTYRINRILNSAKSFRRIKVSVLDVALPMVVLLAINIFVLALRTALSPPEWETIVLAEDRLHGEPSETLGQCYADADDIPYMITQALINLLILFLAIFQAYKARHLSTEFAETQYIFRALIVILGVCAVGFPVLVLANDKPDVYIFVASSIVFVISTSTLVFIFVPKILYARHAAAIGDQPKRRPTHIGGLEDDAASVASSKHLSDASSLAGALDVSGEEILSFMSQIQLAVENEELRRENKRLKKRIERDDRKGLLKALHEAEDEMRHTEADGSASREIQGIGVARVEQADNMPSSQLSELSAASDKA